MEKCFGPIWQTPWQQAVELQGEADSSYFVEQVSALNPQLLQTAGTERWELPMDSWSMYNTLKPKFSLFVDDHQFWKDPEGWADCFQFTNFQLHIMVLKATYSGNWRNVFQGGNRLFHCFYLQWNSMTFTLCLRGHFWTWSVKAMFSEAQSDVCVDESVTRCG